jgi:Protein of unknown function (DUF1549)/Protein of unknown function (DUF1553)/Planctomycete cytochrome C
MKSKSPPPREADELCRLRRPRFHPFAVCATTAAFVLLLSWSSIAPGAEPTREQIEFFEQQIRPVLVEHCYKCHSAQAGKVKGKLLLDTRAGLLKGGEGGPAVVPGDPAASRLLRAIRYDGPKMPPDGKLPDQVIADFENWIKHGAADPREDKAVAAAAPAPNLEASKKFWAFQPPKLHDAPKVHNAAWPRKKIDWFLLARLEKDGLEPSPPADRRTWIRRVSFDLIGLPPTPEEVEAFVNDTATDAFEKVVERLLASSHYGERWARPWLDVARYAEDQAHIVGSDRSLFYPNAYLYRDWVIGALNKDLPYDRFLRLQLAADLIEPDDPSNRAALGFLGLGPKYFDRGSPAVMADEWEDRVDIVSRGLLGLTVACARCHDHKFDPIPTEDYYALAGVFASTRMFNRPLNDKVEQKNGEASQPKDALHVVREGTPTDLNIFVRGDAGAKGPVARRRFLRVLSAGEPKPFGQGSGRLELADAIASVRNPLTARVIVNRVWALNFGRPLVPTPSNFGARGERPTHPELLDDLAVRFMEAGWSLKWLQHEIVLSAAYRQSSELGARNAERKEAPRSELRAPSSIDPDNRLLGRMNRRRLSVEAWRDALLSVAGRLDHSVGGPSLDPQDPKERRRTIYSAVSRLELNRMLALFDFPDPNAHADRRLETTTPLQKLFVLNSPFMVSLATQLAERLKTEVAGEDETADRRRIERAYRLLVGRPATETEVRLGLAFLQNADDRSARWQQYAHVLLAANEMLFLD